MPSAGMIQLPWWVNALGAGPVRRVGPGSWPPLPGVEAVTALVVTIYGKEERLRVVWRDMWLRDVTCQVRVVVIATEHAPILLVSTDLTLPPAVIIQLYAARFPMELSLRDLKQYCGLGDYQRYTLLAIHRFVHLAVTAFCLWRLTLHQDQQALWLGAECMNSTRPLTPLSFQRLRRGVAVAMFAEGGEEAGS